MYQGSTSIFVRMVCAVILLVISCSVTTASTDRSPRLARADPLRSNSRDSDSSGSSAVAGPYCGMYCLYAASKLQTHDVPIDHFLKADYLSSEEGSSITDLERAAHDNGLYAAAMQNVSLNEVDRCHAPTLLHVMSDVDHAAYDHFVLFVKKEGNEAVVYDPPFSASRVKINELSDRWDGTALVVSTHHLDLGPILRSEYYRIAGWSILVFAAGVIIGEWQKRHRRPQNAANGRALCRCATAASSIVVVGAVLGILYNRLAIGGTLTNAAPIRAVEREHAWMFLPECTTLQVEKASKDRSGIIVDARQNADYDRAHIPGAVNIPPHVSSASRRQLLASFPRNLPIIVYCQSRTCPYSGAVALDLHDDGFTNVLLYRGGWTAWREESGSSSAKGE